MAPDRRKPAQAASYLAIHDLRVDILRDSVHLRGLVPGYKKKCLAGARARTAFPWTHVSNELRVGQV